MKTKIIILFVGLIILNVSFSQDNVIDRSPFSVQRAPDLSYEELMNLRLIELLQFEDGFLFSKELREGHFRIQINDDDITLFFNSSFRNKEISKIVFTKKTVEVNGIKYKSLQFVDEDKYIDLIKSKHSILKKGELSEFDTPNFPTVIYNWKNNMLIDKEICNYGSNYNFGKVLNKNLTTSLLVTSNNQQCQLFADATDGAIITFPWGTGVATKVFCTDKIWNRTIWFDENMQNPYARSYGNTGNGYAQFRYPTGLTINGPYEYYNGSDHNWDYPIYVADYNNNRIVKYVYNVNNPSPNIWGWRIRDGSFITLKYCIHPIDIEVHKGQNGGSDLSAQNDDILWYNQDYIPGKDLVAINALSGSILNQVNFFYYQGQSYELNPSRISVYRSPDGIQNVLACIDNDLNAVIFFKLNSNGTLSSNTPIASSVWQFYSWDVPTSVKLVCSNPAFGLLAYVTHVYPAGAFKGHINSFKVSLINGWPIADYLSSTSLPRYTDLELKKTNNLGTQNGFVDLFVIEDWNNMYGFRRFKQGIDLIAENVTDYCRNQNNMKIDIKTTNPCRLDFSAQYRPINGNWQPVQITSINGLVWQSGGIAYLPSGSNHITLSANLPTSDNPSLDPAIKITVRMVPQDEQLGGNNSLTITRVYEKLVKDNCSTPSGGCPYLYVQDNEGMKQENNILHRSEFTEFANVDIVDKMKLNITPFFNIQDTTCTLQFRELNYDYSFFDKVQLKAIDHPIGTKVGITENNDVVIYFPNFIVNPFVALLNDSDVTCSLQYDSTCNYVSGDSLDGLNVNNLGGLYQKKILSNELFYNYFISKKVVNNKAVRDDLLLNSDLIDSVAIIMDPEQDRIYPITPAKDWAGSLIAYSNSVGYSPTEIPFSRRENRSEVIIPIGNNIVIDSSSTTWNRNYNITFFVNSNVFYEGFIENDLNLNSAIASNDVDFLSQLLYEDENYATLDNQNTIDLKFKNTTVAIPEGWQRDYVFVTKGRYTHSDGDKLLSRRNEASLPKIFKLHQNFPNPFNPRATIKFDLPKDVYVSIKVYDILGREVKTLIDEFKKAGYYQTEFNGSNFASGVYFYRIEAGNFVVSKKMVLVK